jgi:transposase
MFGKSNRLMASMIAIFSLLSGIDVSYKTIERLYSDPEVEMAIHNLHVLLLKKKGVNNVAVSGDGTGYSLTIKKHLKMQCVWWTA